MNQHEMNTHVSKVMVAAERTFGADAPPAVLEHYAREALFELWLNPARITDYVTELALNDVRDKLARHAGEATGPRRAA